MGQQEYLVIESSNKTIGSCGFKANRLDLFASIEEQLSDVVMQGETEQLSWAVRDN